MFETSTVAFGWPGMHTKKLMVPNRSLPSVGRTRMMLEEESASDIDVSFPERADGDGDLSHSDALDTPLHSNQRHGRTNDHVASWSRPEHADLATVRYWFLRPGTTRPPPPPLLHSAAWSPHPQPPRPTNHSSRTMATAAVLHPVPIATEASSSYEHEDELQRSQEDEDPSERVSTPPEDERTVTERADASAPVDETPQDAEDVAAMEMAMDDNAEAMEGCAGIENLGNTCYMAASLQMLGSLLSFMESVRADNNTRENESDLCRTFLDVMERLRKGKTVDIETFKAVIDDRSPLFVGYDQQDAHEFITTLLDLIDSDCKKAGNFKEDKDMPDPSDEDMENEAERMDMETSSEGKHCAEEVAAILSDLSNGSASKRQRVGDVDMEAVENVACNMFPEVPVAPFSALDNEGIGQLIYGPSTERESSSMDATLSISSTEAATSQPRCKLIGGRMNTEGVSWDTFQPTVQESDMSADTPNRIRHRLPHATEPHTGDNQEPNENSKSPVDSHFLMTCRVEMTCDSCKYMRSHEETYSHLSLEIGADSGSVEDGMRRFFAPERLECKCEKCFADTATKTLVITRLPKCLLLHFKRFIVDYNRDYSSLSYRKNRSNVAFEDALSLREDSVLREFLAEDFVLQQEDTNEDVMQYSLRSVVNHIGSSASCGHYTADCKRLDTQTNEYGWYRFNDEHVQPISSSTAVDHAQRTAYLLMYELVL